MKKRICFIDDDGDFEIPLFKKVFGEEFDLITATNFLDCQSQIEGRRGWTPDLFVLDLYFPAGSPDEKALESLRHCPLQLPNDSANVRQAYLNYLAAVRRLKDVLNAWKQTCEGGMKLAEQVRKKYPGVPIVFYSRKATAEDALRCMSVDGVLDVLTKPSGKTDKETVQLTINQKDAVAARLKEIIDASASGSQAEVKQAVQIVCKGIKFFSNVLQELK